MSTTTLTIEEAAKCLPDLVEKIHTSGDHAVLLKSGLPVARIVPEPPSTDHSTELIAFLDRWQIEHPEPDEQFGEAIEESRKSIQPPRDPWE